MNDKQRLAGFKALVEDHTNSRSPFEETDGSLRRWHEWSPHAKLHYIAGDAFLYGVPFERFADAVRGVLPPAAIADAALRMVLHYERELRGLDWLLPDDGRTESVPLVERLREMLNCQPDQFPADKGNDRGIER